MKGVLKRYKKGHIDLVKIINLSKRCERAGAKAVVEDPKNEYQLLLRELLEKSNLLLN